MSELLQRDFTAVLTVRAAGDPDERIIEGMAVPFGQVIEVQDTPNGKRYRETFVRGATDLMKPERVTVEALNQSANRSYNSHEGAVLVGRGVSATHTDAGTLMALRIARTTAGDEVLELAREGVLTDLSVAFRPVAQRVRPDGVVERTAVDVRRVAVVERGAYSGAQITAVRAEPDPPAQEPDPPEEPAPPVTPQDPPTGGSSHARRKQVTTVNRADRPARIDELKADLERIATEYSGELPADVQVRWDDSTVELGQLNKDEEADAHRRAFIAEATEDRQEPEVAAIKTVNVPKPPVVRDIYSLAEIRNASRSPEDESQLLRDSAMRAIEAAGFPQMDRAVGQGRVQDLLDNNDSHDRYIAHRILLTGKPSYRRALRKTLTGQMLNVEEMQAYSDFQEYERTMNITTGSLGGFGITFDLDPTMVQTSTGAIVPYRRAARVVNVTTNEWRGVTSGGVVASYAAESAAATDNSPTLAQPAALVQKAHAFVPFTMEIQGDYPGLEAELAREIQDAKDVLEAVQFTTGAGTTVFPQGIVTGSTVAFTAATTGVLAAADLYNCEMTLAPRFRTNARWFAQRMFYNKIRAIDTAGGAQLWTQNLQVGLDTNREGNTGYRLLGYPAEECSGFTATYAGAGNKVAVFGDASYFVIVDRVGLNLELVPILFGGAQGNLPTGQRGLYAWWRNTSKVLSAAAFLTFTTA